MRILKLLKWCFENTDCVLQDTDSFIGGALLALIVMAFIAWSSENAHSINPGRKLKYYEYEMPPREIADDGASSAWTNQEN